MQARVCQREKCWILLEHVLLFPLHKKRTVIVSHSRTKLSTLERLELICQLSELPLTQLGRLKQILNNLVLSVEFERIQDWARAHRWLLGKTVVSCFRTMPLTLASALRQDIRNSVTGVFANGVED